MARLDPDRIPRHVAIIPDGNGRWAESRKLPRNEGHTRGCDVMRDVVRASHELGVRILTLYAFSTENWDRPKEEVQAIMGLLAHYIETEADELDRNGIRVTAIGRLGDLRPALQDQLRALIQRTERNDEMRLTFALSYGGRAEIVDAVRKLVREVESGALDPETIDEKSIQDHLYAPDLPDPDLLIRTGDATRISNFLLWQLAYAELYVTERLWPDFRKEDLVDALVAYQGRERRFGRTGAQVRGGG
jgi:undecaprenyl diphosphate synthase